MIERINFWGIPGGLRYVGYFVPMACAAVLLWRLRNRMRLWWRVGRPEHAWDHLDQRVGRLLRYGFVQLKVLRQNYPGIMHAGIAWGFFVFFLGTALATIDADFVQFLRGPTYLVFKFALDVFTAVALLGVLLAAYRRFFQKPERLTRTPWFAFSLALVFLVVLTGLLTESLRLTAISRDPTLQPGWGSEVAWSVPLGWLAAQPWLALELTTDTLERIHLVIWLIHVGLVGLLFVALPFGPLLHVITAPLNIFFSTLDRPAGRLPASNGRDGTVSGAGTLRDFTWRQLLQGDACTECGRCQDVCPAHASGQPLSPKRLMLSIREALTAYGSALPAGRGNGSAKVPTFTGEVLEDAVAWSCTTCRACVAECPVLIEHVDTIVDLRRYLLAAQRADSQLSLALGHLRRYGNSFGKSDKQRAKWTTGLDFKIKDARKEPTGTLWFTGDYASYNPALTEVTLATARVFQRAGLDFGLLYDAERNAGNDVRRVGEEGLFELLSQKNLAAFQKCRFERIVTSDPHTYNTLKNEYMLTNSHKQPLSAKIPVLHYTELVDELTRDGRLKVLRKLDDAVTYHDPCYLGRYNGIYEAPRRVLRAAGCRVIEMPRNRDSALCCGAGGGRIWMDEGKVRERPAESRIREAAALGVGCLVVACPKDLTMYRDAVKTAGLEGRIVVRDLIELVDEATRADARSTATAVGKMVTMAPSLSTG